MDLTMVVLDRDQDLVHVVAVLVALPVLLGVTQATKVWE
jgi:hypothetical protein